MDKIRLSAGTAMQDAFRIFGKSVGLNVGYAVIYFVLSIVAGFTLGLIPGVSQLYSIGVAPILLLGFAIMADRGMRNESVEIGSAFNGFQKFGSLIAVNILVGVLSMGLFILLAWLFAGQLIIDFFINMPDLSDNTDELQYWIEDRAAELLVYWPLLALSIIVAGLIQLVLGFAQYFVFFSNQSVGQALKSSVNMAAPQLFRLILWAIMAWITIIVGTLLCGVGLLFAYPVVLISHYLLYRQMVPIGGENKGSDNPDVLDM